MSNAVPSHFEAFRIHDDAQGYRAVVEAIAITDQNEGDVVIKAEWSGINYKDALAGTGKGKILRRFPMSGGIDVAGTVVESAAPGFHPGDKVLVTGAGLSETRDGGYAEYLRLDSQWIIPLPTGLTTREAMVIGTAGFTAALSLHRMEQAGWLKSTWQITEKGRKAKFYEITPRGRSQLATERESWDRLTRGVAQVLGAC